MSGTTNGHAVLPMMRAFSDARAEYRAARQTRFSKQLFGVRSQGSSADYHYANEQSYFRLVEAARALDRDDLIAGAIVNRLINNVIQEGFGLDPKTSNPEVNELLKRKWTAYASDPELVDIQGESNFKDLERSLLRHIVVDGDVVVLPLKTGQMQAVENHRLRSPLQGGFGDDRRRRTIHGVELNASRRRIRYWFTADDISPFESVRFDDFRDYAARDSAGIKQVWHLYHPKRISQTRGVTALAPVTDAAGMHDDVQFAKLVQQQGVSSWVLVRQRPMGFEFPDGYVEPGTRCEEDPCEPGQTRPIRNQQPGLWYTTYPGETVSGFSPNVPNPTFFDHAKQIQQLISINLDVPLILLMYDGSETNFSGWRGSMDQAKVAFRCLQYWYASVFHRNAYFWKLRQWTDPESSDFDEEIAAAATMEDITAHEWIYPSWPYIEPLKDVTADTMEMNGCVNSPRRIQKKHSRDWDNVSREIVEDNALIIRQAKQTATAINTEFNDDDPVRWKDLISLPTLVGVNASRSESIQITPEGEENAKEAAASE